MAHEPPARRGAGGGQFCAGPSVRARTWVCASKDMGCVRARTWVTIYSMDMGDTCFMDMGNSFV
jgi:hypothetical protein